MAKPQTGGCLCGKIRYELDADAEPIYSVICHCVNCKKATGTHMMNACVFKRDQFKLVSGQPKVYSDGETDSGKPLSRHFCGDCGSPVYINTALLDEIVSIPSGTLDEATVKYKPNKEQYIETKSHWLPDLPVVPKEDVIENHPRGPLSQQWLL